MSDAQIWTAPEAQPGKVRVVVTDPDGSEQHGVPVRRELADAVMAFARSLPEFGDGTRQARIEPADGDWRGWE